MFMFEPNREWKAIEANDVAYSLHFYLTYNFQNELLDSIHSMTVFYDDDGRIIKEIDHEFGDTILYTYAEGLNHSNVVFINNYSRDSISYQYDEEGKLKEECEFNYTRGSKKYSLDSCVYYVYYPNLILVSNRENSLVKKYHINDEKIVEYDSKGNTMQEYRQFGEEYRLALLFGEDYYYEYNYRNDGQLRSSRKLSHLGQELVCNFFAYKHSLQVRNFSHDLKDKLISYEIIHYVKR